MEERREDERKEDIERQEFRNFPHGTFANIEYKYFPACFFFLLDL